jgi:hypothetical protein
MRILKALGLSLCGALLCGALGAGAKADEWNKKTIVTFGDAVEIPGQVLPAGTYVFRLADSASNRHIVQIWSGDESQLLATIMTVTDYRLDTEDRAMFEFEERPSDSPLALHSWFYPGDNTGQQFVYPRYR